MFRLRPRRWSRIVQRFTFHIPAGDLCDFAWSAPTKVTTKAIIFGNPTDPRREIDHIRYEAVNINEDTGLRVVEDDRFTVTFTLASLQDKDVGLYWHLTTPDGKRVKVSAGQFIVDPRSGLYLKQTPHIDPGFADVVCTVLGGHPAG